ncbi:hypothetical protein ACJX0J_023348, partial [Zea mays]
MQLHARLRPPTARATLCLPPAPTPPDVASIHHPSLPPPPPNPDPLQSRGRGGRCCASLSIFAPLSAAKEPYLSLMAPQPFVEKIESVHILFIKFYFMKKLEEEEAKKQNHQPTVVGNFAYSDLLGSTILYIDNNFVHVCEVFYLLTIFMSAKQKIDILPQSFTIMSLESDLLHGIIDNIIYFYGMYALASCFG